MSNQTLAKKGMSKETRNTYIHLVVAVVLFLLCKFGLSASEGGLTEQGVNVMAVFVPLAYLWTACNITWPSILANIALVALGVTTGSNAWHVGLGDVSCVILIASSLLCVALADSGALRWIARWILSRNFLRGRPYLFVALFGVATGIVSAMAGLIAGAVGMLLLAVELREQLGVDKDSDFNKALCMEIMWMAPVGDLALPYGKVVLMLGHKLMNGMGITMAMTDYVKLGVVYAILVAVMGSFCVRFVMKPDLSAFNKYDLDAVQQDLKANPITKQGKVLLVLLVFYIFLQLAPDLSIPGLSEFCELLGSGTLAFIPVIIGFFIRMENKPAIDIGGLLPRVNWGVTFFCGTIFLMAGLLSSADSGITAWVKGLLAPMTSSLPVYAVICIALFLAVFTTNVGSNALIVVLIISSFMPTLVNAGLPHAALVTFGIAVVQGAMTAFATPGGSSATAVIMSNPLSGVTVKNTIKVNMAQMVVMSIILCVLVYPIGCMIL